MARARIYIPEEVKKNIREHLNSKYIDAVDGYYSASEDEDTLTGDLGGTLRIKNQKVNVKQDEINGIWTWSIDYTKFRGRGNSATENILGADGIIQLELNKGFRIEKKSVLFQSKNNWIERDKKLIEQCSLLTTWREAAFVLNFQPEKYEAFNLDFIFESRGKKPEEYKSKNVAEFLGEDFLNCLIGDTDLIYDARRRILQWKSIQGMLVATKFSIPHRIKVEIKTPIPGGKVSHDKIIENSEIHNYRMDASVDEILSLPRNYTEAQLKKSKKQLALLYHPDKYNFLHELEKAVLNRRMQEINHAYDVLIKKERKNNK